MMQDQQLPRYENRIKTAAACRDWSALQSVLSEQQTYVERNCGRLTAADKASLQRTLANTALILQSQRAHMQDEFNRNQVTLAILSAYQTNSGRQAFDSVG